MSTTDNYTSGGISLSNLDTKDYYFRIEYIPPPTYNKIYGENVSSGEISGYYYDGSYYELPSTQSVLLEPEYTSKTIRVYKDTSGGSYITDDHIKLTYSRRDPGGSWLVSQTVDDYLSTHDITIDQIDTKEQLIKIEKVVQEENGDVYGNNHDHEIYGDIYYRVDGGGKVQISNDAQTKIEDNKQDTYTYLYKDASGTAITADDYVDVKISYRTKNVIESWTELNTIIKYETTQSISLSDIDQYDYYLEISHEPEPTYNDIYGENQANSQIGDLYVYNNVYHQINTSEAICIADPPYTSTNLKTYKDNSGSELASTDYITLYLQSRNPGDTTWTTELTHTQVTSTYTISLSNIDTKEYKLLFKYEPDNGDIYGHNFYYSNYPAYLKSDDDTYILFPQSNTSMETNRMSTSAYIYKSNSGEAISADENIIIWKYKRAKHTTDSWTADGDIYNYDSSAISISDIDTYDYLFEISIDEQNPAYGKVYGDILTRMKYHGQQGDYTVYYQDDDEADQEMFYSWYDSDSTVYFTYVDDSDIISDDEVKLDIYRAPGDNGNWDLWKSYLTYTSNTLVYTLDYSTYAYLFKFTMPSQSEPA